VRDFPDIARKVIADVTTDDIVQWKTARLAVVSPGSVERDIRLISHVFTTARKVWKWCADSPVTDAGRPGDNDPRTRRVAPSEVRRIVRWLGYRTGRVTTKQHQVALAFLLALRTAMRASEVLQLSVKTVDFTARTATIRHKTQYRTGSMRVVPLTAQAIRLLRYLGPEGFSINSASLDAVFRKARDALQIEGLRFHDSRAEALTRFARKVDVMTLARISGHKDLRLLLSTYYRESAADIAARLR
jgi:integrase